MCVCVPETWILYQRAGSLRGLHSIFNVPRPAVFCREAAWNLLGSIFWFGGLYFLVLLIPDVAVFWDCHVSQWSPVCVDDMSSFMSSSFSSSSTVCLQLPEQILECLISRCHLPDVFMDVPCFILDCGSDTHSYSPSCFPLLVEPEGSGLLLQSLFCGVFMS